jgi:hypothetical protein
MDFVQEVLDDMLWSDVGNKPRGHLRETLVPRELFLGRSQSDNSSIALSHTAIRG